MMYRRSFVSPYWKISSTTRVFDFVWLFVYQRFFLKDNNIDGSSWNRRHENEICYVSFVDSKIIPQAEKKGIMHNIMIISWIVVQISLEGSIHRIKLYVTIEFFWRSRFFEKTKLLFRSDFVNLGKRVLSSLYLSWIKNCKVDGTVFQW